MCMAITFRLEDEQLKQILQAVNGLSENLAKWQGQQTETIDAGFNSLVETLGGVTDAMVQAKINEQASGLKSSTDTLDAAVKQRNKGD